MLKINVIASFLYTDYTNYTWISIKINFGNSSRLGALILPLLIHFIQTICITISTILGLSRGIHIVKCILPNNRDRHANCNCCETYNDVPSMHQLPNYMLCMLGHREKLWIITENIRKAEEGNAYGNWDKDLHEDGSCGMGRFG